MFSIIDLTQTLTNESLSYPGTRTAWAANREDVRSDLATLTRFSDFDPHGGTHLDAPLHFAPEGQDVAELPLRLFSAIVVSVSGSTIDVDDIPHACAGRAVLFSTGWEDHAGAPDYYTDFPFVTPDAAKLLVDRGADLVGLDSPSVDGAEGHPPYPAHETLCGAGVSIIEGLVTSPRAARC